MIDCFSNPFFFTDVNLILVTKKCCNDTIPVFVAILTVLTCKLSIWQPAPCR